MDNAVYSFYIRTYGCQMNVRESEKLAGMLLMMGYFPAASEEEADLVLYNTCCVRANAENKIFGNLGYLKHRKASDPELIIVLCGCMVQQRHVAAQIAEQHPYVDVVFGTYNRLRFPALLEEHLNTNIQVIDISEEYTDSLVCESGRDADFLTIRNHAHKAGVNVMYGCDNFCAYCVVPYVRGRERSRDINDVLREVRALAADGVKEIMLLGQNVNAYGAGANENFADLLCEVNKLSGLLRIRFMTSHPKDVSDALIHAIRDCDKVCKSLHLPLQSGSSRVLKDMNRKYTKEHYLDLVFRLKKAVPGIAISTDIMVGYPGETEKDFHETLDVVKQAGFAGAFTFIYSPRTGTKAFARNDIIPDEIINDRFQRLNDIINPILLKRNESLIGRTLDILIDGKKSGVKGSQKGRADDNTLVHVSGMDAVPGDMVKVKITEAKTFYVLGAAK